MQESALLSKAKTMRMMDSHVDHWETPCSWVTRLPAATKVGKQAEWPAETRSECLQRKAAGSRGCKVRMWFSHCPSHRG